MERYLSVEIKFIEGESESVVKRATTTLEGGKDETVAEANVLVQLAFSHFEHLVYRGREITWRDHETTRLQTP